MKVTMSFEGDGVHGELVLDLPLVPVRGDTVGLGGFACCGDEHQFDVVKRVISVEGDDDDEFDIWLRLVRSADDRRALDHKLAAELEPVNA